MTATKEQSRKQARAARSAAEWVAFGIASAIVLGIAGSVGWLWVTNADRPPRVEIQTTGTVRAEGGQFYVPVSVANRGDRTAQEVQVLAELTIDGEVVEDGEQGIDFLAGGDVDELTFIFTQDPASGELTIRVASYAKP